MTLVYIRWPDGRLVWSRAALRLLELGCVHLRAFERLEQRMGPGRLRKWGDN